MLNRFFPTEITLVIAIIIGIFLSFIIQKQIISKSPINQLILVFGFVVILFIPFVGEKQDKSMENRALSEFPEWRWTNVWKFFKDYQKYFDDRFKFKNELVEFHGEVKYDYLKSNNLTSRVIFGEDGWLFFNEEDALNHVSLPLSPSELQRINYNLTLITIWLEERGIKYYLTFPPEKHMVYKDRTPDFLKIRLQFSTFNQIHDYLSKHSKYNFINFFDDLQNEKLNNEVYLKYDTHWNERGAFVGYQSIIKTMSKDFPQLKAYNITDFNEKYERSNSGDLLRILGYQTKYSNQESVFELKNKNTPNLTYSTRLPDNPNNVFQIFEMENDTNNLEIFVIRDSFTENLKKFLSLNFKKSVYDWTPYISIQRINEYKPDIVLHEILERFNFEYFKLPAEIENDTTFVNRFKIEDF